MKVGFNDFGERLAKLEGANGPPQAKPKWTTWIPLGVPVLALLTIVVSVGIHLDNKIGASQKEIQGVGVRLGKLEDAIKVLNSQQSDQTQKLIHDLLSAAKTVSNAAIAAKVVETASSLTATLQKENRAAPPIFFEEASRNLTTINRAAGNADLKSASFAMQYKLAEYRSSLIPVPSTINITVNCRSVLGVEAYQVRNTKILGNTISDGVVANCFQQLDGTAWVNMVFLNSDIAYFGGPVVLKNVKFIHCTFRAYKTEASFGLYQYVASDKTEFEYPKKQSQPSGL